MRTALVRAGIFIILASAWFSKAAYAQNPDISLRFDVYLGYLSSTGNKSKLRWYDPMGRHSTVGFGLNLESGYYVQVTERLQRIDRDPDTSQLEEAYVEDPGSWRLGRQFIPFGERNMLRESALAARLDSRLLLKDIPVQIAACNNGSNNVQGLVGRIGSVIGLSFAAGHHFGVSGTALTQFRRPEESPGRGRGYEIAMGADATRSFGNLFVSLEYLALRRGETPLDRTQDLSDLRVSIMNYREGVKLTGAWSRSWRKKADFYRVEGDVEVSRNVSLRPFVRFSGGKWQDLGMGARFRF